MPPFVIDPEKMTVCDVVRRWAERRPEAAAFAERHRKPLSYKGLVETMDRIGKNLASAGFGAGNRIAVVHNGGADMLSVILSIMDGATAVPLDANSTKDEFSNRFSRMGVTALAVQAGEHDHARRAALELGISCLDIRTLDPQTTGAVTLDIRSRSASNEAQSPSDCDIPLVLATSGTTSKVKIVPLRWRQIMVQAISNSQHFALDENDWSYVFRPLFYAGPILNCLTNLYAGGGNLVTNRFDADTFFRDLVEYPLTWMICGPTYLSAVHERASTYQDIASHSHLRFIRTGTSRAKPEMTEELERLLGASILESYATTEAGQITSNPNPPAVNKRGTVGITLSNKVAILDADRGPISEAGISGEIIVRGDRVIDGYEGDEDANAESFIDGWYRTGDEGFFDEDGYLTITGRIKELINRGGEKVSPAEVDEAITAHSEVQEAATFPLPHPTLGEEVAAVVVRTPGSALIEADLCRFLLDRLSKFKVPRCVIFSNNIPKNSEGKVQRITLAQTLGLSTTGLTDGSTGQFTIRRPSVMENRLLQIWRRALRNRGLGIHDNFFLAGGDSLQAEAVLLDMERAFNTRLPTTALYQAGTVAEMAKYLHDLPTQGALVAIRPGSVKPPFFCVHPRIGNVGFLYLIASHISPDQPVHGLQPIGWDEDTVPFIRPNDMAAHYVAEIRKIQPSGPYFLAGYSFGGRIAVYMARLLRQAGEEVAFVGLIDTVSLAGKQFNSLVQWLERSGKPRGVKKLKAIHHYCQARIRAVWEDIYDLAIRTVFSILFKFYKGRSQPLPRWLRRPDICNRVMRLELYRMPKYGGTAIYFKAADADRRAIAHSDIHESWPQIVTGGVKYVTVPGNHFTMMREPNVETLSKALERELAEAQAKFE